MSIRPRFAARILAGEKTIELRRRKPQVPIGSTVFIYSTMPSASLVGTFVISRIDDLPLASLWNVAKSTAAISFQEFHAYFTGLQTGVAISIANPTRFSQAIGLDALRTLWPGFRPPQSYRFLTSSERAAVENHFESARTGR